MAAILILLIRVLLAAMLGLGGLLALLIGIYLAFNREFVLLGGPGVVMLVFLLIGTGLLYGSGRLFRTTLTLPAA